MHQPQQQPPSVHSSRGPSNGLGTRLRLTDEDAIALVVGIIIAILLLAACADTR